MNQFILVINTGSSSFKFSLFTQGSKQLNLIYHGQIENLQTTPELNIFNKNQVQIVKQIIPKPGHRAGLKAFFGWLEHLPHNINLQAVGHRIVHGGSLFSEPTLVSDEVMAKIASLIPLAPLHQPHNLAAIKIIRELYPQLTQVVCFDTSFHATQDNLATQFAIPRALTRTGIRRYGFHGLSYEYIATILQERIGPVGNERVIIAHLGNGASMCAIYQGKSIATSMGFTALDGLMMGTRPGRIDPGIILYLLAEKKYSIKQIEDLLYHESGLLGVSGKSHNVQALLADFDPPAQEAIDLFCYRAALEAGSLFVALKGCDAFIFTAGIGEHAPLIRQKIAEQLNCLGIKIDAQANKNNATIISTKESKVVVAIIPTDEEYMLAKHVTELLNM